jgi:hypothetical protein
MAALWLALGLLAGCGGGEVSWCFSGGSGTVSAGYNSTDCPPDADKNLAANAP